MSVSSLVSIIVPVYNAEKTLQECIFSIRQQTYQNVEIILVNDGSTDGSEEICSEWGKKYKNIHVLHQANAGVSSARNKGMDVAQGEHIVFVDGDDTLPNNFVEQAIKNMEKYNLDVVIGGMRFIYPTTHKDYAINMADDKDIKIYEDNIEDFISNMLTGQATESAKEIAGCVHCGPCARVYRKSAIKEIRFKTDLFLAEDLLFNFEVFLNCKRLGICKDIWYNYIQNSTSITKIAKKEAIQNFRNIEDYAEQINIQTGNKYKAAWDVEVLSQFSYALQRGIVAKQLKYSFAHKYKLLKEIVTDEKLRKYISKIDPKLLTTKKKILFYIFKYKLIIVGIFITKIFVKSL